MNTSGHAFLFVDLPAGILMVLGLLLGLRRGLSGEMGRILCLLLALWVGWAFHPLLAEILNTGEHLSAEATRLAAFGVVTLAAWGGLTLLRFLLRHLMEFRFKRPLEPLGGALSGMVRYGLLAALLLYAVLHLFPSAGERPWFRQSLFARMVHTSLTPWIESTAARHPLWRPEPMDSEPYIPPADEDSATAAPEP